MPLAEVSSLGSRFTEFQVLQRPLHQTTCLYLTPAEMPLGPKTDVRDVSTYVSHSALCVW